MEREVMINTLDTFLSRKTSLSSTHISNIWEDLILKFKCEFSNDFVLFMDLINEYHFLGELLYVSKDPTNENDDICGVYDYEIKYGDWDVDLIPFYGIGNGDYFCLKASECPESAVYYYFHDDSHIEQYTISFACWINQLNDFLNG